MRSDNRENNSLRPVTLERGYTKYAPGSVLISYGDTKVLVTASVEEKVPPFLRDAKEGWLTAEYSLLPGATHTRFGREISRGKPTGRTTEIQRLIGRALRSILDMKKLGERSIYIDADVIQADGGTRTAAITGGMLALWDAVQKLMNDGLITENPIIEWLGAVSVGKVSGEVLVDLCYSEDFNAEVDMNVVMTESGKFVEIQGTAEKQTFNKAELDQMLGSAEGAITSLISSMKQEVCVPG